MEQMFHYSKKRLIEIIFSSNVRLLHRSQKLFLDKLQDLQFRLSSNF